MPEALSCVVDVDVDTVVVVDEVVDVVVVVQVEGAVGWASVVLSVAATSVVVALRVLESSNDGAAVGESGPRGAEHAPSVRTAAVAATRGVIFMGEDGVAGDDGRRDGAA